MSAPKNAPTRVDADVFEAVTKLWSQAVKSGDPLAGDLCAILQNAALSPRRRRGRSIFVGGES